MTDWSLLTHAYGSAEDIPVLLNQIEADPSFERWDDLWSPLCHQGTVYPASFAALPWLAAMALADDQSERLRALVLAGAIVAGADQTHGAGDVRAKYAPEIADLLRVANEHRSTVSDRTGYGYLLQAILGFEGDPVWSGNLTWGLENKAYDVSCPGCEAYLSVEFGDDGYFSTRREDNSRIAFNSDGGFSLSGDCPLGDDAEKAPLQPARPGDLHGIGRRLHAAALADGQRETAATLTYVFGSARCTACSADFCVARRSGAEASCRTTGRHRSLRKPVTPGGAAPQQLQLVP
ncbi:hypothetical protein ASE03_30280 [Kitasatospora sp. Root187]|nr:hypothetical protein ASC99_30495 [Kitasatospora sp. Root107]KRB68224.1 hypothetical protein ASE03_30280 [Kitasatospora sp. Root187]